MKKFIVAGSLLLLAIGANAQTIYTADGTLSANRTVNLNAKTLHFKPSSLNGLFINTLGDVGIKDLNLFLHCLIKINQLILEFMRMVMEMHHLLCLKKLLM